MKYLIQKRSKFTGVAYLVDRTQRKDKWWTADPSEAIQFNLKSAAKIQLSKIKFGSPEVVAMTDEQIENISNVMDERRAVASLVFGEDGLNS